MKALITGVNGFVGPYLAAVLRSKKIIVVGIDRQETTELKDIIYYQIDILNEIQMQSLFSRERPDIIFHLAGISSVQQSWDEPDLTKSVNVDGTKILLKSIPSSINPKLLFISSAEVYGIPQEIPITESHPVNPQNPYAESKLEAERLVRESNLPFIICRSFQHIGAGQRIGFVCPDFAKQIADIEKGKQKPVIYVGNLHAVRDFTDVRDIADAYYLAISKGMVGETYNICSGTEYVIKDILNRFLKMSKTKISVEEDPMKVRPVKIPIQVGDYSKFSSQTGWKPKIPLEKSLADIMEFWRKN
jgi:GDP-4-dehydro-6-deoxy-D-mannose reductase